MSAQLQRKLGRLVVSMLWQADISIDVIDVDALHCMLGLGNSTKTILPDKKIASDKPLTTMTVMMLRLESSGQATKGVPVYTNYSVLLFDELDMEGKT